MPEAPKGASGGTKIFETVLYYMPEAPKGGSGGTKIFETVLYDTPVPRKAPTEGQKYPKLFCMTHLCPERRLRRDKTRDNAGRVLCENLGSFSGAIKKYRPESVFLMAVKSRTLFR